MYATKELRMAEFGQRSFCEMAGLLRKFRIVRWLERWVRVMLVGRGDERAFGERPTCFRTGNTSGSCGPVPRVSLPNKKVLGNVRREDATNCDREGRAPQNIRRKGVDFSGVREKKGVFRTISHP